MAGLQRYEEILEELKPYGAALVAVSKKQDPESVRTMYQHGQRLFGENYVSELLDKKPGLPDDIQWHFIGHLQSNKVKILLPFVSMIQGIDSFKLLAEIHKQSLKIDKVTNCLLQMHIASEETKFGFNRAELEELLCNENLSQFGNLKIKGLMGMASLTDDQDQVRNEFRNLRKVYEWMQDIFGQHPLFEIDTLSMGMSSDYRIALDEGSTMIRIGSAIFGERPA